MFKLRPYNVLLVGGTFDNLCGKSSKIFTEIKEEIEKTQEFCECNFCYMNGGNFQDLIDIKSKINTFDVAIWFAKVSNEQEKIIQDLKKINKKLLLISSKQNLDGKYNINALIQHALGNKSNLFIEFTKNSNRYYGRVLDPLGNQFSPITDSMALISQTIAQRVNELLNFTRVGSESCGEAVNAPQDEAFFAVIRQQAEIFSNLIYGTDKIERFLGNSSFRCVNGFPSFKQNDIIFVSRRNLDKSLISMQGFVAVKKDIGVINYYGNHKPSVDTPIQIMLYNYFNNVRYMLHSHVYIKDAPMTQKPIPCGAIEEFQEIISVYPHQELSNFSINLKGHGSLVLADNVDYFQHTEYIARPIPELQF